MLAPLTREPQPARIAAAQIFVVTTLLGLIATGQHNITMRSTGGDPTFGHALGMGMPYWYLWALFVPFVAYTARRFPFRRKHWLAPAAIHLSLAVAATLVHSFLEMSVQHVLGLYHSTLEMLTVFSLSRAFWPLPSNLLAYAAILGAVIAADYSRRAQRSELAAATLTAELAEARLQALRAQLNPHFLFNAMNSIAMLVRKGENPEAVTMIAGLSDLMRYFLDEHLAQEVPLREELAFIERYLAVERLRFQDRLVVRIETDPKALDAYVPNLVLQPLVENALKHGIARRAAAGRLTIRAQASATTLTLSVADDGPGPDSSGNGRGPAAGLGLKNVRARLLHLYGAEDRLQLVQAPEGGALVTITLPYRSAPA